MRAPYLKNAASIFVLTFLVSSAPAFGGHHPYEGTPCTPEQAAKYWEQIMEGWDPDPKDIKEKAKEGEDKSAKIVFNPELMRDFVNVPPPVVDLRSLHFWQENWQYVLLGVGGAILILRCPQMGAACARAAGIPMLLVFAKDPTEKEEGKRWWKKMWRNPMGIYRTDDGCVVIEGEDGEEIECCPDSNDARIAECEVAR